MTRPRAGQRSDARRPARPTRCSGSGLGGSTAATLTGALAASLAAASAAFASATLRGRLLGGVGAWRAWPPRPRPPCGPPRPSWPRPWRRPPSLGLRLGLGFCLDLDLADRLVLGLGDALAGSAMGLRASAALARRSWRPRPAFCRGLAGLGKLLGSAFALGGFRDACRASASLAASAARLASALASSASASASRRGLGGPLLGGPVDRLRGAASAGDRAGASSPAGIGVHARDRGGRHAARDRLGGGDARGPASSGRGGGRRHRGAATWPPRVAAPEPRAPRTGPGRCAPPGPRRPRRRAGCRWRPARSSRFEANGLPKGSPSRDASEEQAAAPPPITPMSAKRDSVFNPRPVPRTRIDAPVCLTQLDDAHSKPDSG